MGPSVHLFFFAFKTATLALELQVSTVSQPSSVDGQPAKGLPINKQ